MRRLGGISSALAVATCLAAGGCREPAAPALRPLSVTPDRGPDWQDVAVTIRGDGFDASTSTDFEGRDESSVDARFAASLGAVPLRDVRLQPDGSLTATVPAGLPVGAHDLTVVDPEGREGRLAAAYRVVAAADAAQLVAAYRVDAVGPQQAWAPFPVTVTALDAAGATVSAFSGAVTLTDLTGSAVPGAPGLFRGGVWTGLVEVRSAHAADVLTVTDALGRTGVSAPFPVAPTPPATLRFSTPARTTAAGACSGPSQPVTVDLLDAFGAPTVATAGVALTPAAFPGLALFADDQCSAAIASPGIPAGAGSVTLWYRATLAGGATVELGGPSLASAAQVETVLPGPPARVAFVTPPQSAIAGGCSQAATVELRDAWENLTTGGALAIALAASPTSGFQLYSDATCSTPATGVASDPATARADFWFRGTAAQLVNVTASSSGLVAATQVETITPEPTPSRLAVLTPARTAVAGSCSGVVTVEAQDSFGNAVEVGAPLPLAVAALPPAGLAFFADAACAVPLAAGAPAIVAGGSAAGFYFEGTDDGTVTVTVAATGLTSATQDEHVVAAPPGALSFTSAPQAVGAGSCSAPVELVQRDAFGNLAVSTAALDVALAASPPDEFTFYGDPGCVTQLGSVSIVAGATATRFYFKGRLAGGVTVDATASGLAGATQVETIDPAAADHLLYATGPRTVTAGECSADVSLQSTDALGNAAPVPLDTIVALAPSPAAGVEIFAGGGCLGTPTASVTLLADTTGVVFSFRATAAGDLSLTAAASGLAPDPTQVETVVVAAPSRLEFTTLPQIVTAGGCSAVATVRSVDAYLNASPVASDTTVALAPTADPSLGFYSDATCTHQVTSTTLAAGSGAATFFFRGTLAGPITITASVTGWTAASQPGTIAPAAASRFDWGPISTPQLRGRAFPIALTALDAFGNVATSFSGTAELSLSLAAPLAPAPTLACPVGCAPATLTTGPFTLGRWAGSASVSEPASPTPGVPDRSLVATSGALTGASSAFELIWVPDRSPPTAALTATPAVTWVGQPVVFDASGSTDYQTATADLEVSWDLDGSASGAPPGAGWSAWTRTPGTVNQAFTAAGSYTARVAVRDGDGDLAFASVTVIVRASRTDRLCLVDVAEPDLDWDDAGAVTSCAAAAAVGDGLLSFAEALRLAVDGDTIGFAPHIRAIGGGAPIAVDKAVTIVGYGVVLDGRAVTIGSAPTAASVIGLTLANLATRVIVPNGQKLNLRDVSFLGSAGLQAAGALSLDRVRMEGCAGACVVTTDTSGQDIFTARRSTFRGDGAGVALDVAQCKAGKPALVAQSNVFAGFQTAIRVACDGSATVVHNTFEANGTGVAFVVASTGHSLRNNVFTHQSVEAATCAPGATFSNRDHHLLWPAAQLAGCLAGDAGTLTGDPLYVLPGAGDLRLQPTSPALGVGTSPPDLDLGLYLLSAFPAAPGPRFLGPGPDRGGLESY